MEAKFIELTKELKTSDKYKCTDEDLKELVEWGKNYKKNVIPKDYYYYIIIVLIVLVVIIYIYGIYYGGKPKTELIDAMNDPKNKSDGIDVLDTEEEFDDDGNQIVYVDG